MLCDLYSMMEPHLTYLFTYLLTYFLLLFCDAAETGMYFEPVTVYHGTSQLWWPCIWEIFDKATKVESVNHHTLHQSTWLLYSNSGMLTSLRDTSRMARLACHNDWCHVGGHSIARLRTCHSRNINGRQRSNSMFMEQNDEDVIWLSILAWPK